MRSGSLTLAVGAALVMSASPTQAAPPLNDSPSTAIVIPSLPYSYEGNTSGAVSNGPRYCSNNSSVFFTYAPSETSRVQVDTYGSDYDTVLAVYTRRAGLRGIRCNDDRIGLDSGVRFPALEGRKYFIMVAECCGFGRSSVTGTLRLHVAAVASEPLEATLEVTGGTFDPIGGDATIEGTVTCSTPTGVPIEGALLQVREGVFVARSWPLEELYCPAGGPTEWSIDAENETDYAFGAGNARFTYWAYASDGFRQTVVIAERERVVVTLVEG